MKTNYGLVEYAKAQLGKPYWYGSFGNGASKEFYNQKKRQYPGYYLWSYKPGNEGVKVHDCVGLVKGYLWCDSPTDNTPRYNAAQDKSANGMRNACTKKGDIASIPDVPGVLVFMNGHTGVYIGNGEVIEARGHAYGVVKTKLKDRAWKWWGYCPYITYEEPKKEEPKPVDIDALAKAVINGDYGNGEERKKKLGSLYGQVQARVNEMLRKQEEPKPVVDIDKLAREVINGDWGNGAERKQRLTKAGYDYRTIQNRVNELLR